MHTILKKKDQCTRLQPEMWKLVVLEWRVCDPLKGFNSFWVCTLEFYFGLWDEKIVLETIPIKLPRCSFLQDEIIKNHQVLAAFLSEIICSIKYSSCLSSLISLQILAYLIWALVLYQSGTQENLYLLLLSLWKFSHYLYMAT